MNINKLVSLWGYKEDLKLLYHQLTRRKCIRIEWRQHNSILGIGLYPKETILEVQNEIYKIKRKYLQNKKKEHEKPKKQ